MKETKVDHKCMHDGFCDCYGVPTAPIETLPGEIVRTQFLGVDLVSEATITMVCTVVVQLRMMQCAI